MLVFMCEVKYQSVTVSLKWISFLKAWFAWFSILTKDDQGLWTAYIPLALWAAANVTRLVLRLVRRRCGVGFLGFLVPYYEFMISFLLVECFYKRDLRDASGPPVNLSTGGGSVMVRGCTWSSFVGDLVRIDGVMKPEKHHQICNCLRVNGFSAEQSIQWNTITYRLASQEPRP